MSESAKSKLFQDHSRRWRECRYVYPVIARRSKGVSIGVNLNPDKHCTFACVYCQVDRRGQKDLHAVDLAVLRQELQRAMKAAYSGELWREERYQSTPAEMRRVNDIAFSGEGEPTLAPEFDKAVEIAAEARRELGQADLKIVVISNATQFDQGQFVRALPTLAANNGEIWAKLDAGTEEYFAYVNHPYPRVTLAHILRNITAVAKQQPLVIQTLLMRLDGAVPPASEIAAYCRNVGAILQAGGKIKMIQLHTIARRPAWEKAGPLSNAELDAYAEAIRKALPAVKVETYYGVKIE